MITENLEVQKITIPQISEAIKSGYTPKVVVNGCDYILELSTMEEKARELENFCNINLKDELIQALKNFSNNPDAIENFSSYLDTHFYKWLDKFAYDPISFIDELKQFSKIGG
jgi:hypothetical protein